MQSLDPRITAACSRVLGVREFGPQPHQLRRHRAVNVRAQMRAWLERIAKDEASA